MKTYNFEAIRILVVEDNRFMRSILVNVLRGLDVREVAEAKNGLDAIEELRGGQVDLVVMDWEMDEMNGMELLKTIRSGKRNINPLLHVIVVSANTIARNIIQARDTGMTEFLAKPVSANAIYSRMAAIVENPRRFVRTESYFGPDRRRRYDSAYGGPRRRADDDGVADLEDDDRGAVGRG